MNDRVCNHCDGRITEGMEVVWNKGEYHPGCVGEAVLANRAAQEDKLEDAEIKEALNDWVQEPEEDIADQISALDFPEEEDFDDLEPGEELEERRVIIPEVVESDFRREVHINDVVAVAAQNFVAARQEENGNHGTLMAHCGTVKVDRHFLAQIGIPEETDTFKPISHATLVDAIEESLSYRRIRLVRSEFAVSKDGMKMFGLLEVNNEFDGIRFAIGLRNANDKSMRLAMVAGYRVFVCDNMSLAGDFKPLLAKHTKKLDLIESVSMGIDRIQRGWEPLRQAIQQKKETKLCTEGAKLFIYKAFTEGKIPISLFRSVHETYFQAEEQKTVWGIENAFTDSFKKLLPVSQFENTAKLGKLIQSYDFA